jgi:hypothetical protein
MVEADSHLKMLPASILDICKVFKHIDMLFGVYGSSLKELYPHYLGHILGLWVTCRVHYASWLTSRRHARFYVSAC